MRVKYAFFLPVFLCTTFLFRMFFLSFGPVNAPIISYHRNISFKRKLVSTGNVGKSNLKEQTTPLDVHSTSIFPAVKNKAIRNRKLDFSLLLFLTSVITLISKIPLSIKINSLDFTGTRFLSSRKHIVLSTLRI